MLFRSYIQNNCDDNASIVSFNEVVFKNVTVEFNRLEVINSCSIFELTKEALKDIKDIVNDKVIGAGEINECK